MGQVNYFFFLRFDAEFPKVGFFFGFFGDITYLDLCTFYEPSYAMTRHIWY
jgi:hypothetical protein